MLHTYEMKRQKENVKVGWLWSFKNKPFWASTRMRVRILRVFVFVFVFVFLYLTFVVVFICCEDEEGTLSTQVPGVVLSSIAQYYISLLSGMRNI